MVVFSYPWVAITFSIAATISPRRSSVLDFLGTPELRLCSKLVARPVYLVPVVRQD
jgi:hypothetical protein